VAMFMVKTTGRGRRDAPPPAEPCPHVDQKPPTGQLGGLVKPHPPAELIDPEDRTTNSAVWGTAAQGHNAPRKRLFSAGPGVNVGCQRVPEPDGGRNMNTTRQDG